MPNDFNIPMSDAQITEALQLMVERVSEGWAQETYDGSPVGSGSPYYHKSSKYWATRSEDAAARAEAAVPAGTAGAVFFDRVQTLTAGQQKQARENIGTDKPSENKSASGDIVSFADGSAAPVKDLKATLDIVQGGAGTPSPSNVRPLYPVTEVEVNAFGKNYLNPATLAVRDVTGTGVTRYGFAPIFLKAGTYTISKGGGSVAIYLTNITEGYTYTQVSTWPYTFTLSTNTIMMVRSGAASASGYDITNIQLEKGSTATTYEAYNGTQYLINIGINQFDKSTSVADSRWNTSGTIAASGTTRSAAIPIQPNTAYYFKNVHSASVMNPVWWLDSNQGIISSSHFNTATEGVATSPANAAYVGINFPSANNDTAAVNYPSRFTSYYPYTGNAVYGGELDVTTGVLTSMYGHVDLGSLTWSLYGSNTDAFIANISPYGKGVGNGVVGNLKCSSYPADKWNNVSGYSGTNTAVAISSNGQSIIIRDPAYTDAATFKTAVTGQKLAYELATPIPIQLTPTEVQTLTGTNNLWADSGAVNVSYWTEGLVEADNLNAVLDSKKVVYASPHTYNCEEAKIARDNIGAGSNRNLLDNPWWGSAEVVNQRGFTSGAVANGISTIDRWRSTYSGSDNTFAITANGLEISVGGVYVQYYQRFEDITRFEGKTLTASVLLSNGTIYSGTITRVNGTVQIMVPQSGNPLAVVFQSDNTLRVTAYQNVTIRAVKLELGSVSTLANDAPPVYQQELAKCQYYFERISAPDGNLTLGVGCVGQQLDRVYAPIKIAPKRAKPTITMTGSPRLGKYTFVDAYGLTVTALSWTAFDPKTGLGTLTAQIASASMAQSDFYRLGLMQGNTIDLSADL